MPEKYQGRKTKIQLIAQEKTLEKIAKKKPLAISVLAASSLFFAASIGFGMGVLGSFIYLVVIFPIIAGSILGHIIYRNAIDLKIKQWSWLLLVSLMSAFVLYWMYQYGRYFTFQAIAAYKLLGGFSNQDINATKQVLEIAFIEETGHGGFIGYLSFVAQKGISIGKIISSSKLTLKGWLVWFYWLAEFGLVAYFTAATSKDAINFSESEEKATENSRWLTE